MLDAEAALTRAQARLGVAPPEAAEAVDAAARADRFDVRDLALRARAGGNPVIPLVADLTALAGKSAAPYVHRGATSQDVLDTAMMLVATRTLGPVLDDLTAAAEAAGRLAAEHRGTVQAARTLTQQAVPTTFGLKAAGWQLLLTDAAERLTRVRDGLPAQLGGAAGTLAAFEADAAWPATDREQTGHASLLAATTATEWDGPTRPTADQESVVGEDAGEGTDGALREHTALPQESSTSDATRSLRLVAQYASELGLAEPLLPWHVLRTPVADLAGALAFASGALGKVAADVLVMGRTEIGELAEGTGGGSSAMPHKANPVRATLIAAAARQVPALASVLYASMAAEDERPAGAWHAEWPSLRSALRLVGGAARDAAELLADLRVDTDRMRANLAANGGLLAAEQAAVRLEPLLGRGEARRLVERVATSVGTGTEPTFEAALRAELASLDIPSTDHSAAQPPTPPAEQPSQATDPAAAAPHSGEPQRTEPNTTSSTAPSNAARSLAASADAQQPAQESGPAADAAHSGEPQNTEPNTASSTAPRNTPATGEAPSSTAPQRTPATGEAPSGAEPVGGRRPASSDLSALTDPARHLGAAFALVDRVLLARKAR
ncbi:lyase family protein [Yinghuangia seranimata]|uniref:lyase family protein n=1 Tax=Yinghuangia seranimata TaxID=408067 RepID=UPI003CCF8AC5